MTQFPLYNTYYIFISLYFIYSCTQMGIFAGYDLQINLEPKYFIIFHIGIIIYQ